MQQKLKSYPFILSIIWWALLLFVNPIGDFPLNDDWAYALNVKALVIDNEIYFSDWPAMTLIAHTLWGALFCKIFGFSFTVLRFSTLIWGWVGMLATYHLFRESYFSKKHAFWGTLLIVFNPLYFSLSYSYMTEVPFFAFMVLASLYFIKALKDQGNYNIIIATFFSIITVLIRQLGILMPLAFLFVFFIKKRITFKVILQGLSPILVTYGLMASFIHWRETNYGFSESFGSSSTLIERITWEKFQLFIEHLAPVFTSYWGFFLLPLLILILSYLLKTSTRKSIIGATIAAVFFTLCYWKAWDFNLLTNLIYNLGLGPRLIFQHSENAAYHLAKPTWQGIRIFSFFAGVILVFIFSSLFFNFLGSSFSKKINSPLRYFPFEPVKCYAIFAAAIYLGFLVFNDFYFDRYHLPLLPFFIIIIFPTGKVLQFSKLILYLSGFFFLILTSYSIGGTRDYLTYNRSNWELINRNNPDDKIPTDHIVGGLEYNSWYNKGIFQLRGWFSKEWWFNNEKYYLADFGNTCYFNPIDSIIYQKVFPFVKDTIYFSERMETIIDETIICGAESITADSLHFISNDSTILLQNNDTQTSDKFHSGKHSIKLNNKNQYAFNIKLNNIQPCEKIWVEVWRYPVHSSGAIVFSADDPKNFYKSEYSWVFKKDDSEWGLLSTGINIPKNFEENTINFYLWNPTKENVWFDDLKITRVKY